MSLLALIKKGGLANILTVTPATIATFKNSQPESVTDVAGVTVANTQETKLNPLTLDEESRIFAWLAHINETNQETIDDIVCRCRTNVKTRQYLLRRSDEKVTKEDIPVTFATLTTCENCKHFERISHPHLGYCLKGELEAIAGLWDDDLRYCESYTSIINLN